MLGFSAVWVVASVKGSIVRVATMTMAGNRGISGKGGL